MTRIFESSHDVATLGPLTAAGNPPRKLASLADLVRHMICCEGLPDLPSRAAAAKVLDTLAAADPQPDLYLTDPVDFACPITPETVLRVGRAERAAGTAHKFKGVNGGWTATDWRPGQSQYRDVKILKQSAIAERRGVPGLLDELREAWCINARSVADLDKGRPALAAMLHDVAAALFGLVEETPAKLSSIADQSPESAPAAASKVPASRDASIVQPEGGAWQHVPSADWSDAEREAMFTMRHKNGMTGEQIAKVVGVSRARVDELIGRASSPKTRQWPLVCEWRPSPALLLACGCPAPQPLQAVAAELARA